LHTLNANAKKLYIFKYFAKSKKLFFLPISIILCLILIKFETLKPPMAHQLSGAALSLQVNASAIRIGAGLDTVISGLLRTQIEI
jgi:hypothetical protein